MWRLYCLGQRPQLGLSYKNLGFISLASAKVKSGQFLRFKPMITDAKLKLLNAKLLVGKSFGSVNTDIERKNISIAANIGGRGYCVPYSLNLGYQKRFVPAYPLQLAGNKTLQVSSKCIENFKNMR